MFRFFRTLRPSSVRDPLFNQVRHNSSKGFTKAHGDLYSPGEPRFKFSPTVLIIGFIPLFTFGLGTWQVQRRRWKLDLIEQLNDQITREPLQLPPFVNLDVFPEFEFRRFEAEGEWDHDRSILLGPKSKEGQQGYDLITPLTREGGSTILVDRGFISKIFISNHKPNGIYTPKGKVKVLGMMRMKLTEKNLFTPDNIPEKGEWYFFDLPKLTQWFGGEEKNIQPVFLEEVFDGNTGEISYLISHGIPVGRPSEIELRNMHATYAATWYSLSAATALMFFGLIRKKPVKRNTFR